MIEVLSPVGSPETLVAAVRSGADAVYLGAKMFSARRNATNFDDNQLEETVKYCHARHVKVYVTVNILIKEKEIDDVKDLLFYLNKIGVDGIISQDLAVAYVVHQFLPDMPLHGSTQMSINDPHALVLLKELGFNRVVIAREMNKDKIREFTAKANVLGIEVEMFVHGALCMSVSGQCLLSAMLGGRSGNRGLCAQACRLPFKVENGTGYDLSLKDLSLYQYINEIKEMGIASLKIEGRMKRPEYVAMATDCCKRAVLNQEYDVSLLKDIFSRSGFSDGYYQNKLGKNNFGIRCKEDVDNSQNAIKKIHEIYRSERQSIGINIKTLIRKEKPIELSCNGITIKGEAPLEATGKPTTKDDIEQLLMKLGNTPYYLQASQIDLDDNLFVRSSLFNDLRRQLVEKLMIKDQESKERVELPFRFDYQDKQHQLKKYYIRVRDLAQIPDDLSGISGVIIPIDSDIDNLPCEVIVEIDRWIDSDEYVINRLNYFKEKGVKKLYVNNLAALSLAKEMGFEIIGGNFLNVTNSISCQQLALKETTISVELDLKEIAQIKSIEDKGIISYGHIPLMLLRNCPLKNGHSCDKCDKKGYISDRLNVKFPIRCHLGTSELLNSVPIMMADKLNDIKGIDFMILYFTIESKQQCQSVINDYLQERNNLKDITRGLYYRSVV